jgi:hypothetical protein
MKQKGLNKREKILLFSAGLVALIYFAIQFGILPMYDRYINGMDDRDRLTSEKAVVEINVASKPALIEANRLAQEQYETLTEAYPYHVPNEEVDNILTDLCLIRHNLMPTSLSINVQPPSPGGGDSASARVFTTVSARMNLAGSYADLANLLNEVEGIQYIQITRLSYTAPPQNATVHTQPNISVYFELTFLTRR